MRKLKHREKFSNHRNIQLSIRDKRSQDLDIYKDSLSEFNLLLESALHLPGILGLVIEIEAPNAI